MLFSVFVVSSAEITSVKRQFKEKLSFAAVLKKIVVNAKIRLRETNIMKKGGRQTGMVILFAEHVMRKYLMKFGHIVFVVFAMLLRRIL